MAGLFTFFAGVAVIHREKVSAAISSVNIQTAPILLLVAGILSLLLGSLGIYFIKKRLTFNGSGKAFITVVSSIVLYMQLPSLHSIYQVSPLGNISLLYSTHFSRLQG